LARPATVKQGKRHLPANVHAIMFWLRNRLPEQWGDRPEAPTPVEIIARIRPINLHKKVAGCELLVDGSRQLPEH
jgi:hypothetical protein